MEQAGTTIGTVSRQILENFIRKEAHDGSVMWDLRENVEWQHHIILDAYVNSIPSPEAYNSAFRVLLEIFVASNPEEAADLVTDIEAADEIGELTAWLDSAPENVDYLTAVLSSGRSNDGAEILAEAQRLYLQEIGFNMIDAINEHLSKSEVFEKEFN